MVHYDKIIMELRILFSMPYRNLVYYILIGVLGTLLWHSINDCKKAMIKPLSDTWMFNKYYGFANLIIGYVVLAVESPKSPVF